MSYYDDAKSDAKEAAEYFMDEIVERLEGGDTAEDNLLQYNRGDSYHHENHVDKSYDLKEAAEVLDVLDEYEETDSGLWEGLNPRDAISAQAAYTYGGAVLSLFDDLIDQINEDDGVQEAAKSKWHVKYGDDTKVFDTQDEADAWVEEQNKDREEPTDYEVEEVRDTEALKKAVQKVIDDF